MQFEQKIDESIEKIIQKSCEEYKKSNIKSAKFLDTIRHILFELDKKGYSVKVTNQIINDTFDINIPYTTFYNWFRRNITKTKKSTKQTSNTNIKKDDTSSNNNIQNSNNENQQQQGVQNDINQNHSNMFLDMVENNTKKAKGE